MCEETIAAIRCTIETHIHAVCCADSDFRRAFRAARKVALLGQPPPARRHQTFSADLNRSVTTARPPLPTMPRAVPAQTTTTVSVVSSALAHRPKHTHENSTAISSTLAKPFTPPLTKRSSVLPPRKKRKTTTYAEESADDAGNDLTYSSSGERRTPLGGLDINALKARRREIGAVFRKTFAVPLKCKERFETRIGSAPSLGMLRPANFVPRPLHDPAGEFAIVLYDPTVDDEPAPKIQDSNSPSTTPVLTG